MRSEALISENKICAKADKDEKAKAKKYLMRAMKCAEMITFKQQQLERLSDKLISPSAAGLSPLGVRIQGQAHTREEMLATKIYIEDKIKKELLYLADIGDEIQSVIELLDDPLYRTILTMRYLEAMKWEALAECLGVSMRHIYRLHDKALEEVAFLIRK